MNNSVEKYTEIKCNVSDENNRNNAYARLLTTKKSFCKTGHFSIRYKGKSLTDIDIFRNRILWDMGDIEETKQQVARLCICVSYKMVE